MSTTNLENQIMALSKEEAFEAASYFAKSLGAKKTDQINAEQFLAPMNERPMAYLQQHEQLARALLLYGSQEEAHREKVEKAIGGAGQKQNIITDQNIVELAGLAVVALSIIFRSLRPNKKAEETTTSDGKTTTTTKKYEETYKMDSVIKSLIDYLKKKIE